MCGIVGYIGQKKRINFLLEPLKRLEYRGYDSCGVAFRLNGNSKKIFLKKEKGKINKLKDNLSPERNFEIGIAHTRWATHGAPTKINAHPHFGCKKEIFLVHNGIIENYKEIKDLLLKRGHKFISQTDTEVIAHLVEEFAGKGSILNALHQTVNKLKGSFAILMFSSREEKIYLARKESPLIAGILKDGFLVASDTSALCGFTKKIVTLRDKEIGVISKNDLCIYNFNLRKIKFQVEQVKIDAQEMDKKGFAYFMLKEIFEQPGVLKNLFSYYVRAGKIEFKELNLKREYLASLNKIFIFACGTAFHAGLVCKYFLEKYARINVEIDVSSEARYRDIFIKKNDLVVAISQSGETADTLASVKEAKRKGAKILGICNVLGSRLTKEADAFIHTLAGPEIGVASTKAYTAQIYSLFLFSLYLARLRKTLKPKVEKTILEELKNIGNYQEAILKQADAVRRIAKKFSKFGCFLFLGRGINYPSALEGALKLKEISYIPAEGYAAGEMKHGPIALIDEYRAVVCIALEGVLYEKVVSNIQEIKARKGKVLGVLSRGDKEASLLTDEKIYLPRLKNHDLTPLLVAIPLQLFAYYVAKNLGCEIDQPRNLAKSVTVE